MYLLQTSSQRPKIVFPEIAMEPRFAYDESELYLLRNNKALLHPERRSVSFLALLNSAPAMRRYVKTICAVLGDEDRRGRVDAAVGELIKTKALPIPKVRRFCLEHRSC